jgi:YVTN family beta-propeller protein
MSEPQVDRNLGQTLELWMDQVAPDRAPTRLLEETFSRTMTTRQAATYPWDRLRARAVAPAWAPSQAWLLLIAVALIVMALGVGWGMGGGWFAAPAPPGPSPSLAPSSRPSPSLSYEVVASPSEPAAISVTPDAVITVTKPIAMAAFGEGLWILTETGGLVRIDTATNSTSAPIQLGGTSDLYNGLAADASSVWATHWSPGIVYRVDPTTGTVAEIETPLVKGVLATADGVWVAHTHDGTVSRIDPATNKIAATITVGPVGNSGPNWLASGFGSIWVSVPNASVVVRIDPATDEIQASITVPSPASPCGGFAIGDDAVWIPSGCDGSDWLTRIDPATNTVAALLDMGGDGFLPTMISGAPWISVDRGDDPASIVRIDPATNQFDRILSPGDAFRGGGDMAVAAGSLWIIDGANDQVLRLPLSAFAP